MQKTIGVVTISLFTVMLFCASTVQAKTSADNAARLGCDLTPFGSEKAGNAEGTITA